MRKRQLKKDQAEIRELKEHLATKTETYQHKNLIVNADFNKEVKKKIDLYRARLKAEAETIAEQEAEETRRIIEE